MYALSSWLPKLMMAAGYSMDNSLMFMMVMNIGAVIGIVGGGILADRFHLKPVLMCLGAMGAIVMSLPAYFNFIAVGLPVLITAIAVALIMNEDESEKISANDPVVANA
jgi:MFS family permease